MAIIGALAKGLVRGAGGAMARNITGRKKTVNPSAIAPKQNVQGQQQKKGGALVKSPTAGITKTMTPVKQISTGAVAKDDHLGNIHKNVLLIESIVTGVYKAEKDNLKEKKQSEKNDARKEKENRLETKPDKVVKKKPTLAQLPKLGVFGWIKRFLGNILAGLFLMKMVDFAKFLPKIIRAIDGITTFIADFGLKLVDALVTFLDFGVKAYDFTIGNIKKLGGNLFGENADKIIGLVETAIFLTTAIATSVAAEALMGGGGDGLGGPVQGKNKFRGVTQGRGGQKPRLRIPGSGPTVTQGRGGQKPGTRFPGTGPKITGTPKVPSGGVGIFKRIKNFIKPIPFIGTLLNIVFGKMEYDDRKAQGQTNVQAAAGTGGGILGSIIAMATAAAVIPEPTSTVGGLAVLGLIGLLGMGGATLGGAAADKVTGADKVGQYQEGGRVRRVKRGIDIKKPRKRKLRVVKPSRELLPPLPTVDEGKLDNNQIEENSRAWWDFLGWAGTGNAEKPLGQGGKILAEKTRKVGDQLGKNNYFGPILRVASKVILDQEITSRDYTNIGRGINLLMDDGVTKGKVGIQGLNEGGLAQKLQFNTIKWVSKTFENSLRDDLKKKYLPSSNYGQTPGSTSGPGSAPGIRDSATGDLQGGVAGGAIAASDLYKKIGANAEQWDIYRNSIALIESNGDYSIPGGSGMYYDGRYQMGGEAKTDGAKYAGLPDPGHSDDPNAQVRAKYRANKELQETIFTGYTLANHTYLMRNETYKNSSIERKLEILGYAHNQGMGGAEQWMLTGEVGSDGFGTKGTKYTDLIAANFRAKKSGKDLELADNAINVPSMAPAPDLSDTAQGKGTEASKRLLQDFPQIRSRKNPQQIYASGLGYFLKSSGAGRPGRGDYGDPKGGDMEHPDHGGIVARHRGTGHNRGVALDLGAYSATMGSYQDDQRKLWPFISRYLKKYGLNKEPFIPQVLHGRGESFSPVGPRSGADGGHDDHFHVEFHKGGLVGGSGLVNALLKTGEMVIDVDSTGPAKDLLLAINQASGKEGIIKAIRDYAPYDARAEQTVIVPEESGEMPQEEPSGSGGSSGMAMIPLPIDMSNPFEFLEYQG